MYIALLDSILSVIVSTMAYVVVLVSPWFFGAWEMWWFWPFTVCIFIGSAACAGRLLIRSSLVGQAALADTAIPVLQASRTAVFLTLSYVPFLLYAAARFLQTDVYMDAERSFLLHLTPWLLGVSILFGMDVARMRLFRLLVPLNLLLLGLYGIVNHFVTGNQYVLWAEGYDYGGRATGSYFCPNHYAGIMEFAFCIALGMILSRPAQTRKRAFALCLAAVGIVGVFLSASRGGGLALVVIVACALVIGFPLWSPLRRNLFRVAAILTVVVTIMVFFGTENHHARRFKDYVGWERLKQLPRDEVQNVLSNTLRRTCRGQMIAGACRAWRTRPWVGIGAGMHQHRWSEFAQSTDGNRDTGEWPSIFGYAYRSFEVHSDWVQLLEEYGLIGMSLFLVIFVAGMASLFVRYRRGITAYKTDGDGTAFCWALSALLAALGMTFHSLGDFNLQMPATVWLLLVIVVLPLREGDEDLV